TPNLSLGAPNQSTIEHGAAGSWAELRADTMGGFPDSGFGAIAALGNQVVIAGLAANTDWVWTEVGRGDGATSILDQLGTSMYYTAEKAEFGAPTAILMGKNGGALTTNEGLLLLNETGTWSPLVWGNLPLVALAGTPNDLWAVGRELWHVTAGAQGPSIT